MTSNKSILRKKIFAASKMAKNQFLNWETLFKLPKMQFHGIFVLNFHGKYFKKNSGN